MSLCQRNLSVTGADFERTGRAALKLDDGACRGKKRSVGDICRAEGVRVVGRTKTREEAGAALALTLTSVIESRPRRESSRVTASILMMTSHEISDTREYHINPSRVYCCVRSRHENVYRIWRSNGTI